jgi:hypothetical protein
LKPDKYLSFFLLVSFGLITSILVTQLTKIASGQITTTIPTISTRNHFNLSSGELNSIQTPTSYIASANIPGFKGGTTCPSELAIYIHGVWVGSNSLE